MKKNNPASAAAAKIPVISSTLFIQLFKYGFASIGAAVTDLATVYFTLKIPGLHYLFCIIIGFFTGTFVNFLISNHFIFRRKQKFHIVLIKHYISSLSGLAINLCAVYILVEFVMFGPFFSKAIALCLGFIFNFIAIKFFAFKDCKIN